MAVNMQLSRCLSNIYGSAYSLDCPSNLHNSLALENHTLFNRYLFVPIKDRIEVPVYCRGAIEVVFDENSMILDENSKYEELAIPLYINGRHEERKTANAIFKSLFLYDIKNRLGEIKDSKGVSYYGSKGIILNSNKEILFLATIVIKESRTLDFYQVNKARIYVHPSVYLHDGTLEKGIIKTLIPYFLEKGVRVESRRNIRVDRVSNPFIPEIVIADVTDKFIKVPSKPIIGSVDETIKEVLQDRLHDIALGTNLT